MKRNRGLQARLEPERQSSRLLGTDETCVLQRTDEMAWTREGREREAEAGGDVRVCCPALTGRERGSGKSKWAFSDYIFAKWD